MSEGCLRRRIPAGLAGMVLPTLLALGCQQLPVPRANTAPIHLPPGAPSGDATTTAEGAGAASPGEPSLVPPLPPRTLVAVSSPRPVTATSTPILDDALARAESLSRLDDPLPAPPPETQLEASAAPLATLDEPPPPPTSPPAATALTTSARTHVKGTTPATPPRPIDPEKPLEPLSPRVAWHEGLVRLRTLARERARTADSTSDTWLVRLRLLDALAEAEEDDPVERPLRTTLLRAIALSERAAETDAASPAAEVQIRTAVAALEDQVPLEISDLRLCRKVNGFGNFEPLDAACCKRRQPLIIYCEMTGVRSTFSGEVFHSRLASHVALVPSQGGEPVWTQALGTAEDVCRRRRRDYFVNYRITLPDDLVPGSYELRLVQNDDVAGKSTSASLRLTIVP